jgi:DNA-binding NarL/FixJ family response regulator
MKSILLAVNDTPQAWAWQDELCAAGWAVQGPVCSFVEARRQLARQVPVMLVTDLRLLDGSVIELIQTLCAGPRSQRVQVVVLATIEADPLLLDALQAGADNFFMVPGAQPGALAAQVLSRKLSPRAPFTQFCDVR